MKFFALLLFFSASVFAKIPQTGKDHKLYLQETAKIWLSLIAENQKLGSDNDQIKVETQKLIKGYTDYKCLLGDFPESHELRKMAQALEKLKAQSPLAKLFIGQVILNSAEGKFKDLSIAFRYIDEAASEINKKDYSPFAKYISFKWLRRTTLKSLRISAKKEHEIEVNHRNALLKYVIAPNRKSEARLKYTFIANFFRYYLQKQQINEFNKQIIQNKDKVDPWLFEMTRGCYIGLQGALNQPKNPSVKEMKEHRSKYQKDSAAHFRKAFKIEPNNPEAAVEMMLLTFAHKDESIRSWFDKAVSIEFDYPKAYSTFLISLHDLNELRAFGRECRNTERFDTIVPYQQVITTKKIYKLLKYNYPIIRQMKLYDDIHEVFKTYEKNELKNKVYLNSEKNYIRAEHFGYAFRVGRYTHARKLHQMFGDTLNVRSVMDHFYIDFKTAIPLSYAMSGSASKLVDQLFNHFSWDSSVKTEFWRSKSQLESFIKMYEDAKAMTSEKESEYFFKVIGEILDIEKKYINEEWVDLTFTKDLRLWHVYGGNWKYIDKNTVEADNLNLKRQYLSSNAFFKPPYVMEVEVESIKSNWRGNHLQAGLIIGRMYGPKTGRTFWVDGLRKRSGMGIPGKRPRAYDFESKSKKNKITVYVWKGHAEVHINDGQSSFSKNDPKFDPLRVGLGIMPSLGISGIVRYSNCRIKKITFGPPPQKGDAAEKLEYYEQRLKTKQLIGDYELKVINLYLLKRYDECLEALKKVDSMRPSWWTPYYTAFVLHAQGKHQEIPAYYEKALEISQSSSYAQGRVMSAYSWYLSTCKEEKFRNPPKALKLALALNELKAEKTLKAEYLSILSAAYSINGNFDKAIELAQEALKMAEDEKQSKSLNERIELYRNKKIYLYDPLAE